MIFKEYQYMNGKNKTNGKAALGQGRNLSQLFKQVLPVYVCEAISSRNKASEQRNERGRNVPMHKNLISTLFQKQNNLSRGAGTMETRDHFKNGVNLQNLSSRI
jgi:hypothetical protein